jgi:hypothetical protein
MSGKVGMKWKRKYSVTVAQAIAQAEERLPELLNILMDIATDKDIQNKDKIDSIKFITDRILAKQNREVASRGIVFTADDFALIGRMQNKAAQTEEFKTTWRPEILEANASKPVIEASPTDYKVFNLEGKVIATGS